MTCTKTGRRIIQNEIFSKCLGSSLPKDFQEMNKIFFFEIKTALYPFIGVRKNNDNNNRDDSLDFFADDLLILFCLNFRKKKNMTTIRFFFKKRLFTQ